MFGAAQGKKSVLVLSVASAAGRSGAEGGGDDGFGIRRSIRSMASRKTQTKLAPVARHETAWDDPFRIETARRLSRPIASCGLIYSPKEAGRQKIIQKREEIVDDLHPDLESLRTVSAGAERPVTRRIL